MNHSPIAVDASVAVKWVVTAEELSAKAVALLSDCLGAGRPIVGPPHLHGEVVNALYQRVRSQDPDRHLTDDEAQEALASFLALPIASVSPPDVYAQAFDFARAQGLPSVYDSLYVVMARALNVELWTADTRLLNALTGRARWVRFIGDFPL